MTSQPQPFDPLQFGYYKDTDGQILPVTTKFFLHHRPSLRWSNASARPIAAHRGCSCRKNNLTGTELSSCDTECENEDCNTGNEDSDNDEVQLVGLNFFSKNAHCHCMLITINFE